MRGKGPDGEVGLKGSSKGYLYSPLHVPSPQAPSCLFTPNQQTPAASYNFPKMHTICSSLMGSPLGVPSLNYPHLAAPLWLKGLSGAR